MNRKLWRILGMFFALFALGSIMLAGCGTQVTATNSNGGSTPTPNGGGSGNCANGTVHTLVTTFQEACVNVTKGSNLQVVPIAQSFHILVNGSWVNGNQVPMKRPGQPKELAPVYVMLATDEASYVSGATVAVTGGKPIL